MACYKPLIAERPMIFYPGKDPVPQFYTSKGNPGVRIIGQFDDKYSDSYRLLEEKAHFTIPCGKCIGCKLDYARHWADRMMLEYLACRKAIFITLTYSDINLPKVNYYTGQFYGDDDVDENGCIIRPLVKKDVSEFIKCLRSKLVDNGENENSKSTKIRFFASGEYGEKRHRPHYHIICFGLSLKDLCISFGNNIPGSLEPWVKNELGQISFRSNFLESTWKERGIVSVSDVSYEAMGYVARYSLKKAKGDSYAKDHDLPEEFSLMSRRPGIGASWLNFDSNKEKIETLSCIPIGPDKDLYWPTYLLEKYFSSPGDIEVFDELGSIHYYKGDPLPKLIELKEKKKDIALNKFLNTYENDQRPYYELQDFLEKQVTFRVQNLKRGDVALS